MSGPAVGSSTEPLNLTLRELQAIDAPVNVADGHARQPPTSSQQELIRSLPGFFAQAQAQPTFELEREAHRAFLSALGQHAAPVGSGRILTTYASSVAIDIVARGLARAGATVALIHPTFDNIPDLLRSHGVALVPLEQAQIGEPLPAELACGDCVFLTTPNNPTGWVAGVEELTSVACECRDRGLLLVLDTSFRGFDPRAQFDHYRLLDEVGVDYVLIEDTGKLWPMLELKLGFLAFSEGVQLPLREICSDVLLTASPVIMRLVSALAEDGRDGGFDALWGLITRNRDVLAARLAAGGLSCADKDSRVSVARVELPDPRAAEVVARLAREGVHALPCGPFFWNSPSDGERFIRIALARATDVVCHAADRIALAGAGSVG
jgi:enduracididine biosynthesis enzyme MppP